MFSVRQNLEIMLEVGSTKLEDGQQFSFSDPGQFALYYFLFVLCSSLLVLVHHPSPFSGRSHFPPSIEGRGRSSTAIESLLKLLGREKAPSPSRLPAPVTFWNRRTIR